MKMRGYVVLSLSLLLSPAAQAAEWSEFFGSDPRECAHASGIKPAVSISKDQRLVVFDGELVCELSADGTSASCGYGEDRSEPKRLKINVGDTLTVTEDDTTTTYTRCPD
jgi:hypothetical protein